MRTNLYFCKCLLVLFILTAVFPKNIAYTSDFTVGEQSVKSDSWQFTVLSTGVAPDYLVDFCWKPFDNYGILIGSRAIKDAVAYRYSDNTDVFNEVYSAPDERLLSIDWNSTGDYAFVTSVSTAGGSNNVYVYDGITFTTVFSKPFITFYDVAFHPFENYALFVGTEYGSGVIYEYDGIELKKITIPFSVAPLNAVSWVYDGRYALIGGFGIILSYNRTGFTVISTVAVNWQDIDHHPHSVDALLVGFFDGGGGGVVQKYDGLSLIPVGTSANNLYGVCWKPSGSFALITGDGGCIFEYNGTGMNRLYLPLTTNLRKMDYLFPNTTNMRYCYPVITGSNGTVLKYRQNDADINAGAAEDYKTDAPNDFGNALELFLPHAFNGFLDTHDASDWYKFNVTIGDLIFINLSVPYSADYNIRLYDENHNIKAISAHTGLGVCENITFIADSTGGWRAEIYTQFGSGSYDVNFVSVCFTNVSVVLHAPNGFEKWTGGTYHEISWYITGGLPPYRIMIAYSVDFIHWLEITNISSYSEGYDTFKWQVPYENSTSVKVRINVTDKQLITSTDISDYNFTIDSTPPFVDCVSPSDYGVDVDLNAPLIITFSEPMNTTSCEISFEITPDPGGWHWSWDKNNITMTGLHNLFEPGETYFCKITKSAKDSSEPGNYMLSEFEWKFTTLHANISVVVEYPNGFENFTVNTTQTIRWYAEGGYGELHIKLQYSTAGKDGKYSVIADELPNTGEYNWLIPDIPTSYNCFLKVTATDTLGRECSDISDTNFTIYHPVKPPDNPPEVIVFLPTGGETLLNNSKYTIKWFATDDYELPPKPITIFLQTIEEDTTQQIIAANIQNRGYYDWYLNTTSEICYINISCVDTSGQVGFDKSEKFEIIDPTADALPEVHLVQPCGGEELYGDEIYAIKWVATDDKPLPDYPIEIFYTSNNGRSWKDIAIGIQNTGVFYWQVPNVNAECYVKVLCRDITGKASVAVSNSTFKIVMRTLERIEINPGRIDYIHIKQKQQFIAKGFDSRGNEIKYLDFKWSLSDTKIGTITDDGLLITGTTEISGFVYVTANYGGKSVRATAMVNVSALIVNIEYVEIIPDSAFIEVDETLELFAQAYTADGKTVGGVFYNWSVVPDIGVINPRYEQFVTFTSTRVGKCIVEVTAYHMGVEKYGYATVYVGIYDTEPPQIRITSTKIIRLDAENKFVITTRITDDMGIVGAYLCYRADEKSAFLKMPMQLVSGNSTDGTWKYEFTIPSGWNKIFYYVNATDGINYNETLIQMIEVPAEKIRVEEEKCILCLYLPVILCAAVISIAAAILVYLYYTTRVKKVRKVRKKSRKKHT